MERLLSLTEMAERLQRTPRQFRKDVTTRKIPHIQIGRNRLFDPEKVVEHLMVGTVRAKLRTKAESSGRFAEVLGL